MKTYENTTLRACSPRMYGFTTILSLRYNNPTHSNPLITSTIVRRLDLNDLFCCLEKKEKSGRNIEKEM